MKRFTDWPQVGLGITFSWGALMGWAAWFGGLAAAPLLLYVGGILWTIGYDTIYAHQDKEDDAMIGIGSTALLFGARTRPYLAAFYAGATLLFAAAFIAARVGWLGYAGLVLGALHLGWQAVALDIDDPQDCLRKFRSNRDFGLILFAGLVADCVARAM
jgi:4-hydroxybenzoate polyprenyltransferase